MSNEAAKIMESVMTRFKEGIPAGHGAVVNFSDNDYATVIGDMEDISVRKDGVFTLDHRCNRARQMLGGKIYVVYRKNKSSNIVIDEFSGREIFRELSWENEESSFVGQSPHNIDDERGLNFIGRR